MRTHGYIIILSLLAVALAVIKLTHDDSTFWTVVCALAVVIGVLTFALGIFAIEQNDDIVLPRSMNIAINPVATLTISVEDEEYLNGTSIPKKDPEWDSQG
jgi:hypothetical protein